MLSKEEKRARHAARVKKLYATSQKYRDKQKNNKLLKAYSITLKQYQEFSAAFDDQCHICSKPCPSKKSLAVDHDHSTGLIRGLLCINCNKGLGNFKDNIELFKKAIQYLEDAVDTREYVDATYKECQQTSV